MNWFWIIAFSAIFIVSDSRVAVSQTLEDGAQAYDTQDFSSAFSIFSKLAEQGLATAQYNLGNMYDDGKGVPENDAEAVRWYRKAAEQGVADAQFNLGLMYGNGEGVPENDAEAVRWYRKAAEQGNASAQLNLGYMYFKGEGLPPNYVDAYTWTSLAKANENANAPKNLDIMKSQMTSQQIAEAQQKAAVLWERLPKSIK